MNSPWTLPRQVRLGNTDYPFYWDYRDMLEIIACLENPSLPEGFRWQIALGLFYKKPVKPQHKLAAMTYLSYFIRCGRQELPSPRRMDWQQDAQAILADINRLCGGEIRRKKRIHWWTFLSWFHSIGDGLLAQRVAIRDALGRGETLTPQQAQYYRTCRQEIDLKPKLTPEEQAEKERLTQLLGEK